MSRVAALYDIHGNLPALEAVLADVARAGVDRIVIGGDVLPGPMPREVIERLSVVTTQVEYLKGNGDRETLTEAADRPSRLPESARVQLRWTRAQLTDAQAASVAAWPAHVRLELPGIGSVLFCHATPRSDEEVVTRLVPQPVLRPIFEGAADVVVCGHTHMQFDLRVGRTRVVNAGSVGMPFQAPGAYWLMLDAGVELRRTDYDLTVAAATVRRSGFPDADQFAATSILQPPDMLEAFTRYALASLTTGHGV